MSLIVSQTSVNRLPAELVNNAAFVKQVDFDPVHQDAETGQPAEKIHGSALPRFDTVSIRDNRSIHIYSDPSMSLEAGPDAPIQDPDAKIRVYYNALSGRDDYLTQERAQNGAVADCFFELRPDDRNSRPTLLSAVRGMILIIQPQSFLSRDCAGGFQRTIQKLLRTPLKRCAVNMRGYWRPGEPLPCQN